MVVFEDADFIRGGPVQRNLGRRGSLAVVKRYPLFFCLFADSFLSATTFLPHVLEVVLVAMLLSGSVITGF